MAGNRLAAVEFAVPQSARRALREFYGGQLGMVLQPAPGTGAQADQDLFLLTQDTEINQSAGLRYQYLAPRELLDTALQASRAPRGHGAPELVPLYWKIGLAVHDCDGTVEALKGRGVRFGGGGGPSQFLDVGYLVHTRDPSGLAIELLQTTMQESGEQRRRLVERARGRRGAAGALAQHPEDVAVGQLTTRTGDIQRCRRFWTEVMGMRLLCVERIGCHGFDLYFFGYPAAEDLEELEADFGGSLENLEAQAPSGSAKAVREWLYQRRFTTLEVQVLLDGRDRATDNALDPERGGFTAVTVELSPERMAAVRRSPGLRTEVDAHGREFVRDPDGMRVNLAEAPRPA